MKVILALFLCFLFCSTALSQQSEAEELSEADKSSIIKSVLNDDGIFNGLVSSASSDNPATIYFSSKNITSALLPKFPNVNYVLLEPNQINLDQRESLTYWEFQIFEGGDSKASVSIRRTVLTHWLAPVANGLGYEFEKIDGEWLGKIVGDFVTD